MRSFIDLRLGMLILSLLLSLGAVGHADIYVWTDENGTVHMQNYGKPQDVVVYYTVRERKTGSIQKGKSGTYSLEQILNTKNPTQSSKAPTHGLEKLLKQHLDGQPNTDSRILELYDRYNRLNQLLKSPDNTPKQ